MTVMEVNIHDSLLFDESFNNLLDIADLLNLDIKGSYLTLDSAFDNTLTKNEILVREMIPVIKPNLRGLKDEERINELLDEFESFEHIYKERVAIERMFAWEDTYRKLVIRYEKLQSTHLGFKYLAYSMINFRHLFGENYPYSL